MKPAWTIFVFAALQLMAAGGAWPHTDTPHKAGEPKRAVTSEEKSFGRAGDPKKVTRVVRIEMSDAMRYAPAEFSVKAGETVRLEVKNTGKIMHEIVLGTMQELTEHAGLMKKHPGMEHDEPYMAHVAPGATGRIVWQFSRPGEFLFGCLIPGHFEAGMIGRISVKTR